MGIQIGVTEFKAKCLELIDKLSRHELDSIELTKRGKPVAVVSAMELPTPATVEEKLAEIRAWQATFRDIVKIDPDVDLTEPVFDIEHSNAYHGRLLSQDD